MEWRIIPVSKWLVTPIYKPFRLFGMAPTIPVDLRTIIINHLRPSWDDPPSGWKAELRNIFFFSESPKYTVKAFK